MRKLRILLLVTIMGVLCMMLYGCKSDENPVKQEELTEEKDITITEEKNENTSVSETTAKMKIYFADSGSGEIISKEVDVEKVTPELIWENLQNEGVISSECALNQYTLYEEEKLIDIDVNGTFGNYIRSMGTTGENIVLTSITRSYLENFGYEGIKITVDGQVLETGHAILDGYMGLQ